MLVGEGRHKASLPPLPYQNEIRELLSLFALLIYNSARGLASGLARCLALAAAAVVNSLCDILCCNSFDSAHRYVLRNR